MIAHDWPLIPDDDGERYDSKGCLPARDLAGLVVELSDGTYEVNF